jgi:hypothetical protein
MFPEMCGENKMKITKTPRVIPERIVPAETIEEITYECEKCDYKTDIEYEIINHDLYVHCVEKVVPLSHYNKLYYFGSEAKANYWLSQTYFHRYHEERRYGYYNFWRGPGWYVSFNDSDLRSVEESIKNVKERIENNQRFLAEIDKAIKENNS